MSYGGNEAVNDGDDKWREQVAHQIADGAAKLVAAGDMTRADAILTMTEWVGCIIESLNDPTGVVAVETVVPSPSKSAPPAQVAAIKHELLAAAREAAENL